MKTAPTWGALAKVVLGIAAVGMPIACSGSDRTAESQPSGGSAGTGDAGTNEDGTSGTGGSGGASSDAGGSAGSGGGSSDAGGSAGGDASDGSGGLADAAADARSLDAATDGPATDGPATLDAGLDASADASPADRCTATGGVVATVLCCNSVPDFPSSCVPGVCSCPPADSYDIQTCDCQSAARCFDPQLGCVAILDAGADGGTARSCDGLADTCGPSENASCCASSVLSGNTFYRSYDGVTYLDQSYPATISDFRLDLYEVTVGRFRKFVESYPRSLPVAGAGKNRNDPSDPGWNVAWSSDGSMPADQVSLAAGVKCSSTSQTWTDVAGGNESKAMNCITWYEAFAFCIWDGGRLPTEAEWNYAAAGGAEQRVYPWSAPPTSNTIDATRAVYGNPTSGVAAVGSKSPAGDGLWGQSDLAGNVWEWALDWFVVPYANPCSDCAVTADASALARVIRGGGFGQVDTSLLVSSFRFSAPSTNRDSSLGVRCAKDP